MASRRQVRYSPLPVDETDDDYHDPRFEYRPGAFDKVPWKSITLALFLLFLGSLLLFLSFFILTGHMGGEKSQGYGLLALGILAFLPASLGCSSPSHLPLHGTGLVFSIGFSSLPISCLNIDRLL
ncbi:uncharacterized protein LOC110620888 isoform X3 [Manihot esculenta]|uniref:uncharacterized protein LOC110620888 isoform X3 n=1 Tax=Manihot esculenta TaxID=3983 RepID=UPI000B5D2859|nr:uncharacterized protein LOC110620888 isoform X3 [Manihot esculenta]